jgi:NADP-dependent 3-hydroxy acid dehydrogenase YdfG
VWGGTARARRAAQDGFRLVLAARSVDKLQALAKETGNAVSFKASIKNPMPLTLDFNATIDGTKIAGTVGAGAIGSWPFSGTKA